MFHWHDVDDAELVGSTFTQGQCVAAVYEGAANKERKRRRKEPTRAKSNRKQGSMRKWRRGQRARMKERVRSMKDIWKDCRWLYENAALQKEFSTAIVALQQQQSLMCV